MKGRKTDFIDWLVMGWVQSRDECHPIVEPDVPVDRAADGSISDRFAFFAERARRLFCGCSGFSYDRFRLVVRLFAILPVIAVCFIGIFIFPIVNTNSILGDRSVNLIGPFGWFFGLQLFFLTLSLISLVLTLLFLLCGFVRNCFRRVPANDGPSRLAYRLGFFTGWIGTVVLRFWGRVMFYLGKQSSGRTLRTDEEISMRKNCIHFFHRVFSHQGVLFYYAGFLSHLFWFICSLVILLLLFNRMLGNRYDYCWNTSLSDTTQAEKVIRFLGSPVARFTTLPTPRHIRWLFDNSDRADQFFRGRDTFPDGGNGTNSFHSTSVGDTSGQYQEIDVSTMRKDWSWFLLAVTAFWTTLPRLFFTLIYWFLCRCALRQFRPRIDAPYYATLLTRYENRPVRQESGKIDDDHLGPLQPLSPSGRVVSEVAPAGERASDSGPIILCSYDLELSGKLEESLLGKRSNKIFLGDLARRDLDARQALALLKSKASTAEALILFLDLGYPPARQSHMVLRDKIFSNTSGTRCFVVLSCAERLRRKFAGDSRAVSDRLNDWRGVIRQIAEDLHQVIDVIDFYDHELDLPEPRRQFLQRLGIAPSNTGQAPKKKFSDACRIVRDQVVYLVSEDGGAVPIPEENVSNTMKEGYNRLTQLYREEKESFFREVPSIPAEQWKEGIRKHLSNLRGAAVLSEKLKDNALSGNIKKSTEVLTHFRKIASGLSPKCALICGTAAAALPLLSLPLLGGTLGAGAVAALGYLPAAMLGSGTAGAAAGAVLPQALTSLKNKLLPFLTSPSLDSPEDLPEVSGFEIGEAIETITVSLTTWALILELQNLPADRRIEVLRQQTAVLEKTCLNSIQAVDGVIETINAGVNMLEY